jgi:hypothetical protein
MLFATPSRKRIASLKNAMKVNRCIKNRIAMKKYEDSLLEARPTGGGDEANDDREAEGDSSDGISIPEGEEEGQGKDTR